MDQRVYKHCASVDKVIDREYKYCCYRMTLVLVSDGILAALTERSVICRCNYLATSLSVLASILQTVVVRLLLWGPSGGSLLITCCSV